MPMQKRLQGKHFFKTLTFTMLILFGMTSLCAAQISITESNPIDIRFSLTSSTLSNTGVNLSIQELIDEHGSIGQSVTNNLVSYSNDKKDRSFYYVSDDSRFIYPGRIQSRETDEATFFTIAINNESDESISSMMFAFDFIYNVVDFEKDYTLSLSYRVNGNQWRNVSGSSFRTVDLSESGEDWSTFSMQLNLTDIFLRKSDQLDLRWNFSGLHQDEVEAMLPLALQRMEINPENHLFKRIHRGQLVITEILTSVDVDGIPLEYIELFNSSENSVSLKGVELQSAEGEFVVQSDLDVEPYQTVVFSNVDLSGLSSVGTHYQYQGSILRSASGRVEVKRGDEVVSRAAYESSEPGVSFELDRVASAISGYTSLQNLKPSENNFSQDLFGSPGELFSTVPLYTRTLDQQGWYFISPPGRIVERLNRHASLEFFGLDGSTIEMGQHIPYTPVMIYKSDGNPVTLYVEKDDQLSSNRIETQIKNSDLRIASFRSPHSTKLESVVTDGDQRMAPLVTVWDESNQRFQLKFSERDQIEGWNPFLMNSDLSMDLMASNEGPQSEPIELNRFIPFTLYDGSGNNRVEVDEAIIGFMAPQYLRGGMSYDLPKLSGTFQRELALPKKSTLYLTSPESKYRANSFIQIPNEFNQAKMVGLGFDPIPGSSGPATIEWSLDFDIPDDWTVKLEDKQTGIVVDMREVNNYRFRYSGQETEENSSTEISGLINYTPRDQNRFTVIIEKTESLVQAEVEEEKPGSIELRQNYPNPFNPTTNITFYLPEERNVRVEVYNIVGQQVSLLVSDTLPAGEHSVVWDASNSPSGIYVVHMETGSRLLTRKITLIK